MADSHAIPVIFENGAFRPMTPIDLPERAHFWISIHDTDERTAAPARNGSSLKASLDAMRARGLIRTGGWRPTRDELHERD